MDADVAAFVGLHVVASPPSFVILSSCLLFPNVNMLLLLADDDPNNPALVLVAAPNAEVVDVPNPEEEGANATFPKMEVDVVEDDQNIDVLDVEADEAPAPKMGLELPAPKLANPVSVELPKIDFVVAGTDVEMDAVSFLSPVRGLFIGFVSLTLLSSLVEFAIVLEATVTSVETL